MVANIKNMAEINYSTGQKAKQAPEKDKREQSLETIVRNICKKSRDNEKVYKYFNKRGINDASIEKNQLGIWKFRGYDRFVIPIYNKAGKIAYLRLRVTPEDESAEEVAEVMGQDTLIQKYEVYPNNAKPILVGEDQLAKSASSDAIICKSALDRIIAIQEGIKMPVVTGDGYTQTFRKEWMEQLKNMRNIYICMGKGVVGERGAEVLAQRLTEYIPSASIYIISLPFEEGAHADLTDYFVQKRGTADELFTKYAKFHCGAEPIDPAKFKELTVDDIADTLNSTIKYDYESKVITFLAMLLAYTESDQLNVMFNASSSTGKSFICHEVSKYFPEQDVNIYGKTTPNAFYYSQKLRKIDEDTREPYIDLERRIMVFVEQPDSQLQANLRAVLSHEKKRVPFAITNKSKNGRNAAEEGYILGYPSAFFCSANTTIDEQEQTRSIILSPDSTRKKVLAGIDAYIDKNCHQDTFNTKMQNDEKRRLLMERILYIKSLKVESIDVDDSDYLRQHFIDSLGDNMSPAAMRGIHKFTALAKAIALVNAPFRIASGKVVVANKDIDEAMKLWGAISGSMVYGLSPQIHNFYKDTILSAWYSKMKRGYLSKGVTIREIIAEHHKQTGGFPYMDYMRKQWIPTLESVGFIKCEKNYEKDKREKLIIPLVFFDETLGDDSELGKEA